MLKRKAVRFKRGKKVFRLIGEENCDVSDIDLDTHLEAALALIDTDGKRNKGRFPLKTCYLKCPIFHASGSVYFWRVFRSKTKDER